MANNPNASNNLRPFPKGVSGNPNGRPRSLAKVIKDLPVEAQGEILGVLHYAISLNDENEARAYLERQSNDNGELGQYGFVFQLAIKSLLGRNGWATLNDILDRLFGKPRIQAEFQNKSQGMIIVMPDSAFKAGNKWSSKGPGGSGNLVVHVNDQDEADNILGLIDR